MFRPYRGHLQADILNLLGKTQPNIFQISN